MKKLRIRRRSKTPDASPLELALAPAVRDGRWRVPDRFNFTRDVIEVLARDPKRRALTFVGPDGIIEPRTFKELAEGANRWASILRDKAIAPGERVLVLSGATVDWIELVLGCVKAGVVVVPSAADIGAPLLESRLVSTGASLLVATDDARAEIARMSFTPEVHHLFEGRRRRASDHVDEQPTEETSARETAFIAWTAGTSGASKPVAHTHGATFAARCAAEHWLGAGPGDVVWCTATPESLQAFSISVFGAWSRGAEVAIHDGAFDPLEHLELLHRFDVTVVCQTPAEYRALGSRRELARYRSRRLRRLVSTGDYLDPDVIARFEEAWGTTIRNGYGQAETNIVVAHGLENDSPAASLGRALPGYEVAIVDDDANELPAGIEGHLAIRDRPPTMFAGYWEAPEETREAFRGDWYLTGDVAVADEEGTLWFVSRAEDTITSRGRTFGPHEVESALRAEAVVAECAVVGIRDLERGGHFLRAFVVLAPGAEGSEQLEAELRHSLGESLREQQVPREIEFVEELPRATSGAVKRGELRERPVAGRPLWEEAPSAEDAVLPEPQPGHEPAAYVPWVVEPEQQPQLEVEPVELAPMPMEVEPAPIEPAPVEAFVEPVAPPVAEPPPEPVEAIEPVAEPLEAAGPVPAELRVAEPAPVPADPAPEFVEPPTPVEPEPLPEPVEAQLIEPQPVEPQPVEPEPVAIEPVHEPPAPAPEPAPVVELVPPPKTPVDPTSEPLPDFVVPPGASEERAPAPPPPAPSALDEEEEADLGPLPEYIVDPERRLEPVASAPAPAPGAERSEEPKPAFPSAADFKATLDARRGSDQESTSRSLSRSRPSKPASPASPTGRGDTAAEPGDEAEEMTWMEGLSSRLSAYSLEEPGEPSESPNEDESETPRAKEID